MDVKQLERFGTFAIRSSKPVGPVPILLWKSGGIKQARALVVKIVQVGDSGDELLQAITRFTNSQNAVREKDFLALTSDFRSWAKQMADSYEIFLEIQRGGWDSQKALQKQHPNAKQFTKAANAFDLIKVYGSGWLAEAGSAFGKNPPFLPNGSIFKRIVTEQEGEAGGSFGVEDLYAAYQLQHSADRYEFGRGATKPSRRLTRFLVYMVVVDLLKDALSRGNLPTSNSSISSAFIKLFSPGNEGPAKALLDASVEAIHTYLTNATENSVFDEPAFKNAFNSDLNGFLKWPQLGRSDNCPRFRDLLAITKMFMGQAMGGQPSGRELILQAVRK